MGYLLLPLAAARSQPLSQACVGMHAALPHKQCPGTGRALWLTGLCCSSSQRGSARRLPEFACVDASTGPAPWLATMARHWLAQSCTSRTTPAPTSNSTQQGVLGSSRLSLRNHQRERAPGPDPASSRWQAISSCEAATSSAKLRRPWALKRCDGSKRPEPKPPATEVSLP